jgi:hypothetical protein
MTPTPPISTTSGSTSTSLENSPCGVHGSQCIGVISSLVGRDLFGGSDSPPSIGTPRSTESPCFQEPQESFVERPANLPPHLNARRVIFIDTSPISELPVQRNEDRLVPRGLFQSGAANSLNHELARVLGTIPDQVSRVTQAAEAPLKRAVPHPHYKVRTFSALSPLTVHIR